jgi:WD40 repeat protein
LDAKTFQPRATTSGRAHALTLSSDGALLAVERYVSEQDPSPKLELRDGARLGLVRELALPAGVSGLFDASFSADGRVLTARSSSSVLRWSVESGRRLPDAPSGPTQADARSGGRMPDPSELRHLGPHASEILFAAWPAGDRWLTGAADGAGRIWDARTGRAVSRVETRNGEAIAWSPDGRLLLGGCGLAPPPRDELLRVDRGEHLCLWKRDGGILYALPDIDLTKDRSRPSVLARFSPDGRSIAILSVEGLRSWDVDRGRPSRMLIPWSCHREACSIPSHFAFAEDGSLWVPGWGRWRIDGTAAPMPPDPPEAGPGTGRAGFALPPKGDLLAFGDSERTWLFHRARGAWETGPIRGQALFFSPEADRLFVWSDTHVDAVDLSTRRIPFELASGEPVDAHAFSPDHAELLLAHRRGEYPFTGRAPGGSLRLWSATTGRAIATIRAVDGTDDSYVMTEGPDARIELFGDAGREHVFCRAGALTLPFDACAERFEVTGLLEKQRRGDLSYLDP